MLPAKRRGRRCFRLIFPVFLARFLKYVRTWTFDQHLLSRAFASLWIRSSRPVGLSVSGVLHVCPCAHHILVHRDRPGSSWILCSPAANDIRGGPTFLFRESGTHGPGAVCPSVGRRASFCSPRTRQPDGAA